MTAPQRAPLTGRAAWRGPELAERTDDWIFPWASEHLAEIDAALIEAKRSGKTVLEITRDDFPLDRTRSLLDRVAAELEDGRGIVRLRGLPVERYSHEDLKMLFWGLGCHLGTQVNQAARGEMIGEVRDETRDTGNVSELVSKHKEKGGVLASRARARSTGPLRFHTDRCDVIALLCESNGIEGGVSKVASAVTIYNEILKRRPDLLDLLCQDYWRTFPEEEDGPDGNRYFALPVFGVVDGKLTTQYSRTYVEQAQEYAEVPRLTAAQNEALDLLAEVAEETCLHVPFVAGDIQLLNNHVVYHGRTAYADDAASGQKRLLLRLWLSMPNSRRLPDGYDVLWGATAPGALRGGVRRGTGFRKDAA